MTSQNERKRNDNERTKQSIYVHSWKVADNLKVVFIGLLNGFDVDATSKSGLSLCNLKCWNYSLKKHDYHKKIITKKSLLKLKG